MRKQDIILISVFLIALSLSIGIAIAGGGGVDPPDDPPDHPEYYCGDGIVRNGEQCEPPGAGNDNNCDQSTTTCNGARTGTRDVHGNCDADCECVYDSFTYSCIQGSCGASCDSSADYYVSGSTCYYSCDYTSTCNYQNSCPLGNYCSDSVRYYSGVCSGTGCSFTSEDCNNQDGWYDTGETQWVNDTLCTEKEQKQQEYRDYYCAPEGCDFSVTDYQWIDTGATRNKEDGLVCDVGGATCSDSCTEGQPEYTCQVGQCLFNRYINELACDPYSCETNMCSIVCSELCGALCDANEDCDPSECEQTYNDYCVGPKLTEYDSDKIMDSTLVTNSTPNFCQGTCACTENEVSCNPPDTNNYCVEGVCGAVCDDAGDYYTSDSTCYYGCSNDTCDYTQNCELTSYCSDNTYYYSGVCSASGCSFTQQDCDSLDYYDAFETYCDGDDVRQHRLFHDYTCGLTGCEEFTSWTDDGLVDTCNGDGPYGYCGWQDEYCSQDTPTSASCQINYTQNDTICTNYCGGDTRYFNGYCGQDYQCHYDSEDCIGDGSYCTDSETIETRDYYCTPDACQMNITGTEDCGAESWAGGGDTAGYGDDPSCDYTDYFCTGTGPAAYCSDNQPYSEDFDAQDNERCDGLYFGQEDFWCNLSTCDSVDPVNGCGPGITWYGLACSVQCGAECDVGNACEDSTCNETYNDTCTGYQLTEYDDDRIMDSTTVTNSAPNECFGNCTCANNSVTCDPPGTNTYCVEDVCDAACDDVGDYYSDGSTCYYSCDVDETCNYDDSCELANHCVGDNYYYSGVCSATGCSFTTEDCNSMDYYDPFVSYCVGDDIYQHRLFHDYSCGETGCAESTYWADESMVEQCDDDGPYEQCGWQDEYCVNDTATTASCHIDYSVNDTVCTDYCSGDTRNYNGYCGQDYLCHYTTELCSGDGTYCVEDDLVTRDYYCTPEACLFNVTGTQNCDQNAWTGGSDTPGFGGDPACVFTDGYCADNGAQSYCSSSQPYSEDFDDQDTHACHGLYWSGQDYWCDLGTCDGTTPENGCDPGITWYDEACSLTCGAACDAQNACGDSTCEETFNDYCTGLQLTEYDSDMIMDNTTVTNSTANECLDNCTCANNTATCNPPETNTYCVEGVCGAACDADEDCSDSTCETTFNDYCNGARLAEYDNDYIIDSTVVTNSTANECQDNCTCANNTASCNPPTINEYCVEDMCGAACDGTDDYYSDDSTCYFSCDAEETCDFTQNCSLQSYCVGNVYYSDSTCGAAGCSFEQQDCDALDYYGEFVTYCSGDEVRQHRLFHDYFCGGSGCDATTTWVNDTLVDACNSDGPYGVCGWQDEYCVNDTATTASCHIDYTQNDTVCENYCDGDVRNYDGYCGQDYLCHYGTELCNGDGAYCVDSSVEQRNYYCQPDACLYNVTQTEVCGDSNGWYNYGNAAGSDDPTCEYHSYYCMDDGLNDRCAYNVTAKNDYDNYDGSYCANNEALEQRDYYCGSDGLSQYEAGTPQDCGAESWTGGGNTPGYGDDAACDYTDYFCTGTGPAAYCSSDDSYSQDFDASDAQACDGFKYGQKDFWCNLTTCDSENPENGCDPGITWYNEVCSVQYCGADCVPNQTSADGLYCAGGDLYTRIFGCTDACAWNDNEANDSFADDCLCEYPADGCNGTKLTDYRSNYDAGCTGIECNACLPPMLGEACSLQCGAECVSDGNCQPHMQEGVCYYSGVCSQSACTCSYSNEYCPPAGTVQQGICYYGTQSCDNEGCGLNTCVLGLSQICDPSQGCMNVACSHNYDCGGGDDATDYGAWSEWTCDWSDICDQSASCTRTRDVTTYTCHSPGTIQSTCSSVTTIETQTQTQTRSTNGVSCDDGLFCTTNDVCSAGVCTGGAARVCNDANVCTDDYCDEASDSCKATNDDTNTCGLPRDCPADQCIDPNWTDFPDDGHDYCSSGQCIEYSCSPISSEYYLWCDSKCVYDVTPPVIVSTHDQGNVYDSQAGPYVLEAKIIDSGCGLDTVKFAYKFDSWSWSDFYDYTYKVGDTYYYEIPKSVWAAQHVGDIIRWKVVAKDLHNWTATKNIVTGNIYDDDTKKPVFGTVLFPSTSLYNQEITVVATITDDSGISTALLTYDYGVDGVKDGTANPTVSGNAYTFKIPAPGRSLTRHPISFYIEATDGDNDRTGDNLSAKSMDYWITITAPPNVAPVAVITKPTAGEYQNNTAILFDGSASSDANGDVLAYTWFSTRDGTLGSTATLSRMLSKGSHTIRLTVSDGLLTGTTTVDIVVLAATTPPAPAVCGNSIVEGSEQCDGGSQACTVGNQTGNQSCSSSCAWNACYVTPGAYCGDGSCSNGETCSNCQVDCGSCSTGGGGGGGGHGGGSGSGISALSCASMLKVTVDSDMTAVAGTSIKVPIKLVLQGTCANKNFTVSLDVPEGWTADSVKVLLDLNKEATAYINVDVPANATGTSVIYADVDSTRKAINVDVQATEQPEEKPEVTAPPITGWFTASPVGDALLVLAIAGIIALIYFLRRATKQKKISNIRKVRKMVLYSI